MTPLSPVGRSKRRAPGRPAGLAVGATLAVTVMAAAWLAAQTAPASRPPDALANFDARDSAARTRVLPRIEQREAINEWLARLPNLQVELNDATGATRTLWNVGGYLTEPDDRDPEQVARAFVTGSTALLGLVPADLAEIELTDRVRSELSGVTHLYFRQRLGGVPVFNGQLHVNVARDGRILSVNNGFLPALGSSVTTLAPALDAVTAVGRAAADVGRPLAAPQVVAQADGVQQATALVAPDLSTETIQARLTIVPVAKGLARLAWNFQVWTPGGEHALDYTVDAASGTVWTRIDWVSADQYRVYPQPIESPSHTTPAPPADGRVLEAGPAHPVSSPFGWHDVNGVPGAEHTITRGNNVHAYTDVDADDTPDPGGSPDCGPSLSCDFPLDLTQPPSSYKAAGVTNLFYWTNLVHDVSYGYGFDEASGNFQLNNYGRGGLGGDSLRAEAQDGFSTNNANFATPPDGSRPRLQMFRWTTTTPGRDGDFDAGIIVHEYAHGISNRLVGGPNNTSCLGNNQQPGEGISDWFSLVYTARAADTALQGRGIGTYSLGQPPTGQGIRTARYSLDPAINDWTYESITGAARPHGVGAVWAQALWEVYWALVDRHGFSANLHDAMGGAGNQRAMLYVTEGLKNTACEPTFTESRDAIIQAAQTLYNGEDVCRIWDAFAGFGLGVDAISSGPSGTTPTNGFNLPVACGGLRAEPPTDLFVESTAGNLVTLRWTPPAGGLAPTQFVLEGGTTPGEVLASFTTGSTLPLYTFVAPNGAYYVRMHTAAGSERSVASNEVRIFVNVPAAPSPPAGLLAVVDGSTLDLAWRRTYEGGQPVSTVLDVTGSAVTSIPLGEGDRFRFTGVPPGTYTVRVRAVNASGVSAPSNPVTVSFPSSCTGAPFAPTGLLALRVGNTILVSWDLPAAGPAPTGYRLDVSGALVGSFPTVERVMSGDVRAGTYNLRVLAVNGCGDGPAVTAPPITVP